jgi:N-acetylglucosaminyldiphosphoundecaprenol N-acetyl-beta-D-mannosaminyltransferase
LFGRTDVSIRTGNASTRHLLTQRSEASKLPCTIGAGVPAPPFDMQQNHKTVLGTRVQRASRAEVVRHILQWAIAGEASYVCLANAHMLVEACDSPAFRRVLDAADWVAADGRPLSWLCRTERIVGRDLMRAVCVEAARAGVAVGFYGASPDVLRHLVSNVQSLSPGLRIAFAYSPPYRLLTAAEERQVLNAIEASGVQVLFVGLGCPKQEIWMASRRWQFPFVQIGVGAAFNQLAGVLPVAPHWMQSWGLEWLFRLTQEPRRLWRRNFYYSPKFIALYARDSLRVVVDRMIAHTRH